MDLEPAIVLFATETGCRVRFLEGHSDSDTVYSTPLVRHQIEVRPGDLVAVDRNADPPETCFCWALATIERVETRVHTDLYPSALSPAEGQLGPLAPGDRVFVAGDRVCDLCVDGLPAHPDRLRREAEAFLTTLAASRDAAPGSFPLAPAVRAGAAPTVEYLTAETKRGRQAIHEVMQRSYAAGLDETLPAWAIARLVDGVPVSYILVDPTKEMDLGSGVPYAFVNDVATREDRRLEGHFRALMEHTCDRVRQAGMPLLLLHGRHSLYRRLGFDVFTHHSGIFITPEQIDRALGTSQTAAGRSLLAVEASRWAKEDLLIVTKVRAQSWAESKAALLAAAACAREKAKQHILFEHPSAPCGSRYQAYKTLETPFTALARTCGAEVRVQGADPENGAIPDADWIKVLDAKGLLRGALGGQSRADLHLPEGSVALETDAGTVTLISQGDRVRVRESREADTPALCWPSSALAQLATGYRSAEVLGILHDTEMSPPTLALLQALFPHRWRFSRNESWTFRG